MTVGSREFTSGVTTATFTGSISMPTSGGTPTTLNYYEEGSFSIDFTASSSSAAGNGGSGGPYTAKFIRIGKIVTISFPSMASMTTGSVARQSFLAASTVPSQIRPVAAQYGTCLMLAAGSTLMGTWNITTSGEIDLYKDINLGGATWATGTANQGALGFSVTYAIN